MIILLILRSAFQIIQVSFVSFKSMAGVAAGCVYFANGGQGVIYGDPIKTRN